MELNEFKRQWVLFLFDAGLTQKQVAADTHQLPQVLNRKISRGTIQFLEFSKMLKLYGFSIEIKKVKKQNL